MKHEGKLLIIKARWDTYPKAARAIEIIASSLTFQEKISWTVKNEGLKKWGGGGEERENWEEKDAFNLQPALFIRITLG